MIKHLLSFSIRSLTKNGFYTALNLLGLTCGFVMAVFIALYISHETSYDTFHEKAERTFVAKGIIKHGEKEMSVTGMSSGFGPVLSERLPEVESYVRTHGRERTVVTTDGSESYFEDHILMADGSFFTLFNFPLLEGQPEFLNQPFKIYLSSEMATKYFGNASCVGKSITLNKDETYTVAGVFAPIPSRSSLQFDFIASLSTLTEISRYDRAWDNDKVRLGMFHTFLLLTESSAKETVEKDIATLTKDQEGQAFVLEQLVDQHLGTFNGLRGPYILLFIFGAVALLIVTLALLNFTNLTIARTTIRSREIGVRKVMGAGKASIFSLFYVESGIVLFSAFLLSLLLVKVFLQLSAEITGITLDSSLVSTPAFLGSAIGVLILAILISGAYPSILLSKFNAAQALKSATGHRSTSTLQKGFSAFQFAVTMGLILATVVIIQQMDYVKTFDTGIDKDQIVVVSLAPAESGLDYAVNEISKLPQVVGVATAGAELFKGGHSIYFTQTPISKKDVMLSYFPVDEHFAEVLGLEWIEKEASANEGLLINKKALEALELEGSALGQNIDLGTDNDKIKGVLEDFNYASLKSEINPLVISIVSDTSRSMMINGASIYIKMSKGSSMQQGLADIQKVIEQVQPGSPFSYYFLDEAFGQMYTSEARLLSLFRVFAGLGMVLALLGLFGLVTFSLERRFKEIGIRKVLGAGEWNLIKMVSKEYLLIYLIAATVALPLAWWGMKNWLTTFSYRIEINAWMGFGAFAITVILAMATVAARSWVAARMNPVDAIKE